MKKLRWFKVAAYLVSGFMVVTALLVLVSTPSDAPLVLLIASMTVGIIGSGLAAVQRREALNQAAEREAASAFQPPPEELTRRAFARHPALGHGELELTRQALLFTGGPVQRLGELVYAGLDLYRAGLWQVARRAFRVWFARGRLRAAAAGPRRFELPRGQVFACAAFDGITAGPELVIGWRPADSSETARWESVYLAEVVPGSFSAPSDDPTPWVRALQPPLTAADGQRQATRARRRIHRRLAFAESVFAASVAGIALGGFVLLMLTIALLTGDSGAFGVAVALVMVWLFTAALTTAIIWWSHR